MPARYSLVKVPLTVSPFRPFLQQQPRAYPRSPVPVFPLLTTHRPLPTFRHPFLSYTYELPLLIDRFARPLVSSTYELLFSQPLCFEKHLRCPIVFSALLKAQRPLRALW